MADIAVLNTVNRLRVEMGLTRPKMLELIGAKPGRLALLTAADEQIDPIFLTRAKLLRQLYSEWVDSLKSRLVDFERRGLTNLTSSEVQDLLSLRDLHVAQLRHRGVIEAEKDGHEYQYSTESLRRLIDNNSTVLVKGVRKMRGPLAFGFLRWLGRRGAGGLDITVPGRDVVVNEKYGSGERALALA